MWDLEEPVGNETAPAFYFCQQDHEPQVKVALTGRAPTSHGPATTATSASELSGLYSRLPVGGDARRWQRSRHAAAVPIERLKRGAVALGEPRRAHALRQDLLVLQRRHEGAAVHGDALKAQLRAGDHGRRRRCAPQPDVAALDPLTQMLYIDTRANLPDDLLMVGDKMSMANSLEARVPFLDYRLVEFIEGLPPGLKLTD